jgi:hypothetical protein
LTSPPPLKGDDSQGRSCGSPRGGSCFRPQRGCGHRQGKPWSYIASTGSDRPSGGQDVAGGVHVAVEGRHVQVLQVDRLVLTDQPGGELVVEVPARVRDAGVEAGDLAPGG